MLSTQGSKLSLKLIIAGWTFLSRAIMMAQVRSLEIAEIKMVEGGDILSLSLVSVRSDPW